MELDLHNNNQYKNHHLHNKTYKKLIISGPYCAITDRGLHNITVEELDISNNDNITDIGLSRVKGLKKLNARGCLNLTDAGILNHTLTDLDISWNNNITEKYTKNLTNLISLFNDKISYYIINGEIIKKTENDYYKNYIKTMHINSIPIWD